MAAIGSSNAVTSSILSGVNSSRYGNNAVTNLVSNFDPAVQQRLAAPVATLLNGASGFAAGQALKEIDQITGNRSLSDILSQPFSAFNDNVLAAPFMTNLIKSDSLVQVTAEDNGKSGVSVPSEFAVPSSIKGALDSNEQNIWQRNNALGMQVPDRSLAYLQATSATNGTDAYTTPLNIVSKSPVEPSIAHNRITSNVSSNAGTTTQHPHYYRVSDVAFCSPSELFATFREAGGSAPGAPYAREGITRDIILLDGNPIMQTVNPNTLTIVNQTQAGHRYHNGQVTIRITESVFGSRYTITGTGNNSSWYMARENEVGGTALFAGIGTANALACSTGF
jgi:hypothetical protein